MALAGVALACPAFADAAPALEAQNLPQNPLFERILTRIATRPPTGVPREDWAALTGFYTAHGGMAIWVTNEGFSKKGQQVGAEIRRADDWGLSARAFDLPENCKGSPDVLASCELKFGIAILKYARQARGGRIVPSQLDSNLDQPPRLLDPKQVIRDIAAAQDAAAYLRNLHPHSPQFALLRKALLRTRSRQGDDPQITRHAASSPRRNDDDDIADRDFPNIDRDDTQTGDTGLPWAPSPRTIQNTDDVSRIIVNMERWRWMPDNLGQFYVWDNVPEFVTRVVKNDRVIYSDKIIVGKPSTPTPVFSARMQSIVFNPEWAVPDSIKINDLLPRLRSEPDFFGSSGSDTSVLREHNLRVVFNGSPVDPGRIDWNHEDIRRFTFLEAPGDQNVLGKLKFRFPNKHDVYMHDTPERALFNRSRRALSHGCMRVGDPRRLAEILLSEDKGWSSGEIGNQLATGYNTEVNLTRAIPVHISYFTAVARDDGSVEYFPDIYGYDTMMADALAGRPVHHPILHNDDVTDSDDDGRAEQRHQSGGLNDLFSILSGF